MGTICAICSSHGKGTPKSVRSEGTLRAGHGLEGDAHAGDWHRQISLLARRDIEDFRRRGAEVAFGDFGENLVVDGIDFAAVKVGDALHCGEAVLEITQLGKECHSRCRIFEAMGDCIMPRRGVFARVLTGGTIRVGDEIAFHAV